MLTLLVLAALAATISVAAERGVGALQTLLDSRRRRASQPSGRKSEDAGSSGGIVAQQPGPYAGIGRRAVVLTEYSDYQ